MPSGTEIKWENTGVTLTDTSAADTKLEEYLKNFAEKGTTSNNEIDASIQKMLDQVTKAIEGNGGMTNAHMILLVDDKSFGYIKYESNAWKIRMKATPNVGYSVKNGTSSFDGAKMWFTVKVS